MTLIYDIYNIYNIYDIDGRNSTGSNMVLN